MPDISRTNRHGMLASEWRVLREGVQKAGRFGILNLECLRSEPGRSVRLNDKLMGISGPVPYGM